MQGGMRVRGIREQGETRNWTSTTNSSIASLGGRDGGGRGKDEGGTRAKR